jgi:hypothetical protein
VLPASCSAASPTASFLTFDTDICLRGRVAAAGEEKCDNRWRPEPRALGPPRNHAGPSSPGNECLNKALSPCIRLRAEFAQQICRNIGMAWESQGAANLGPSLPALGTGGSLKASALSHSTSENMPNMLYSSRRGAPYLVCWTTWLYVCLQSAESIGINWTLLTVH